MDIDNNNTAAVLCGNSFKRKVCISKCVFHVILDLVTKITYQLLFVKVFFLPDLKRCMIMQEINKNILMLDYTKFS